MRVSSCESRALTRSQWSLRGTRTATGLVTFVKKVTEQWSCGGRRLSTDTIFSKTKLCGDELRNGRVPRNVLDCRGTAALAVDSATFRIQSEHDPIMRFCGCASIAQRAGLVKVKALAVKTLWLQEVVRERGLQIKSIERQTRLTWE